MKTNLLKSVFISWVSIALLFSSSCKTSCDDVGCLNGGDEYRDGKKCKCLCPDYFEGEHCETFNFCKAQNFTCQNGGVAINHQTSCECDCPEGASGTYCQNTLSSDYVGSYHGGGNFCGIADYSLIITTGDAFNKVVINNLHNSGLNVNGYILDTIIDYPPLGTGSPNIIIASQSLSGPPFRVSGSCAGGNGFFICKYNFGQNSQDTCGFASFRKD